MGGQSKGSNPHSVQIQGGGSPNLGPNLGPKRNGAGGAAAEAGAFLQLL